MMMNYNKTIKTNIEDLTPDEFVIDVDKKEKKDKKPVKIRKRRRLRKGHDEGNVLRLVENFNYVTNLKDEYSGRFFDWEDVIEKTTRHWDYSIEDAKETAKRLESRPYSSIYAFFLTKRKTNKSGA
ncbi:MAG: hypothetical protein ACE5J7_03015 [Candidatus Aenigmatarchaeota archaeon]